MKQLFNPKMVESMEDSHVIVLIESIRDFPQLWDPLNPDHGRKDISHQIWNTICNRCATYGVILTIEEAKRIWRSLRDTYKRIRAKSGPNDKVRWRFFSDMSFLPANLMDALNGTTNPAPKRPAQMELLEPFRGPLEMPNASSKIIEPIPVKRKLIHKKHELEEIKIKKELLAIEKAQMELNMRKRHLELELQELHCRHETELLTESMKQEEKEEKDEQEVKRQLEPKLSAVIKAEDLLGDDE